MYTDELLSFGRGNDKFLVLVEKTFGEFVGSGKKTQVLPHMPMDRRKFVIEVCGVDVLFYILFTDCHFLACGCL